MNGHTLLVAFDLDGTLFNRSAELSATTIETLDKLAAADRHFVAATGRSHRSAASRLAPSADIRWAVCDNGAVLYDLESSTVVEHRVLDGAYVDGFLADLRTGLPGLEWAWESLEGGFYWTERFSTMTSLPKAAWTVIGQDATPPADMLKLYLAHPDLDQSDLLERITNSFPNSLAITTSGGEFLEATAAGVTKASMLEHLRQRLDVAATNTVAFGDNFNDLDMLRWAATGYAMANAHPDIIAAADAVTPLAHHHDGVADVLLTLLG